MEGDLKIIGNIMKGWVKANLKKLQPVQPTESEFSGEEIENLSRVKMFCGITECEQGKCNAADLR